MFLSLVSNGNLILLFFFYMRVNSITALKLPAIVPKILNKKEAFLSGRFVRLSSSSLLIFNDHLIYDIFSVRCFKGKRYENYSNDL